MEQPDTTSAAISHNMGQATEEQPNGIYNSHSIEPCSYLHNIKENTGGVTQRQQEQQAQHHVPDSCTSLQQALQLGPGEVVAAAEQSAAADFGQLKLLDVQEVAERFWENVQAGRLSYVHHLAAQAPLSKIASQGSRLPPNVQPSVLQHKLCAGANRLSNVLLPTPTADGLAFNHPPLPSTQQQQQQQQRPATAGSTGNSSSSSNSPVWQFSFSLLNATHVGPTGFKTQRQPLYHLARLCIFDKANNHFIGNVHTMPVSEVRSKGSTWVWTPAGTSKTLDGSDKPRPDPIPPGQLAGSPAATAATAAASGGLLSGCESQSGAAAAAASLGNGAAGAGGANTCLVRCAEEGLDPVHGLRLLDAERLSLYIELDVAFRLTAEDAAVVPQAECKGAGLVTELTTCWALVSLQRCAELTRELDISVPLYTGSIYTPGLLSAVWAAERKLHPLRSMFSAAPTPLLTFRAGPLQARPAPLLAYSLMPPTCIARRDVAYLLATARLALGEHLAAAAAACSSTLTVQPAECSPQKFAATGLAPGFSPGVVLGFGDAALAALPRLLDDQLLLDELVARWWGRCRGLTADDQGGGLLSSCVGDTASSLPSHAQLMSALRASLLEVAPLLHCSSMPPPHMTNFAEHAAHRAQQAAKFLRVQPAGATQGSVGGAAGSAGAAAGSGNGPLSSSGPAAGCAVARHPVEGMSRAALAYLHRPFNVAETRVCLADELVQNRWIRC